MAEPFRDPTLTISRVYTRGGDEGYTSLVGGQRVPKDHLRIDAYGTVDELNSWIGMACVSIAETSARLPRLTQLGASLRRVQHELFNLGSQLATRLEDLRPNQPVITPADIDLLEREMDLANAEMPALHSFVLPGGTRLNAELHGCRTVCRRAERIAVALAKHEPIPTDAIRYLNRLSDALFVWSRWANVVAGVEEVLWQPNESASGRKARE